MLVSAGSEMHMHARSRLPRPLASLSRLPQSWRLFQTGRSVAFAIRFFELCLLAGILLAFAAGMMRIR
jgi:hypothetical protein